MAKYYITGVGDGVNYGVYKGSIFDKDKELISVHSTLKKAIKQIKMYEEPNKQDMKNVK